MRETAPEAIRRGRERGEEREGGEREGERGEKKREREGERREGEREKREREREKGNVQTVVSLSAAPTDIAGWCGAVLGKFVAGCGVLGGFPVSPFFGSVQGLSGQCVCTDEFQLQAEGGNVSVFLLHLETSCTRALTFCCFLLMWSHEFAGGFRRSRRNQRNQCCCVLEPSCPTTLQPFPSLHGQVSLLEVITGAQCARLREKPTSIVFLRSDMGSCSLPVRQSHRPLSSERCWVYRSKQLLAN